MSAALDEALDRAEKFRVRAEKAEAEVARLTAPVAAGEPFDLQLMPTREWEPVTIARTAADAERIRGLTEALAPFARFARAWRNPTNESHQRIISTGGGVGMEYAITLGDCRRAALATTTKEGR